MTYASDFEWTVERTDRLRVLWAEGLTAKDIAAAIGWISRSAVLGKAHRLHLKARREGENGGRPKTGRKPRPSRAGQRHPRRILHPVVLHSHAPEPKPDLGGSHPDAWDALPSAVSISLLELTDETCRWPLGARYESATGFCGCAVQFGSTYCAAHDGLAHGRAA